MPTQSSDVSKNVNGIRPKWYSFITRLQSISSKNNYGSSIMTVHILIDKYGDPQLWTEPSLTKIEPKYKVGDILALLSNDKL